MTTDEAAIEPVILEVEQFPSVREYVARRKEFVDGLAAAQDELVRVTLEIGESRRYRRDSHDEHAALEGRRTEAEPRVEQLHESLANLSIAGTKIHAEATRERKRLAQQRARNVAAEMMQLFDQIGRHNVDLADATKIADEGSRGPRPLDLKLLKLLSRPLAGVGGNERGRNANHNG